MVTAWTSTPTTRPSCFTHRVSKTSAVKPEATSRLASMRAPRWGADRRAAAGAVSVGDTTGWILAVFGPRFLLRRASEKGIERECKP